MTRLSTYKKVILISWVLVFLMNITTSAQNPFITIWKTDNPGGTDTHQIEIPAIGEFDYYWEDVSDPTINGNGTAMHVTVLTFPTAGIYQVEMTPKGVEPFARMDFTGATLGIGGDDPEKILEIKQWGDVEWISFNGAYYGTSNLNITAIDMPNLNSVFNMSYAFAYSGISSVHNMANWNVSNVYNMDYMFAYASNFDESLFWWDVGQVLYMSNMFRNATSFNQFLGFWDVSNVLDMSDILTNASSFIYDLSDWDISSVNSSIGLSGSGMTCESYSHTLKAWGDYFLSYSPYGLTLYASGLNFSYAVEGDRQDLISVRGWTIHDNGISSCDVSWPFKTIWKTNNVGSSSSHQITIPAVGKYIYYWEEVDNPSNFAYGQADGVKTLTFPDTGIYRLKITPRTYTEPFSAFNFALSGDALKLLEVEQWGEVEWFSLENAFLGTANLSITATDYANMEWVNNMSNAFKNSGVSTIPNINNWEFYSVSDMSGMFYNAVNFNDNINGWGWYINSISNLSEMFYGASSFNQSLSSWNVSNVTNMSGMFKGATSFNQNIGGWNVGKIKNMSEMFEGAISFNQNISGWNVSKVEQMERMFKDATTFNQDISGWNVGKVESMDEIFDGAVAFNQNLGDWNLESLTGNLHLGNSAMTCENYSYTLQGWAANINTANGIDLYADGLLYSPQVATERDSLALKGWAFINDGLGSCTITPFLTQIIEFTVQKKGQTALLHWEIASTASIHSFIIEKSLDGKDWEAIGRISLSGTPDSKTFSFIDNQPAIGQNFYRIKIESQNRFTYSEIRSLTFETLNMIRIFPNPTTDMISIEGLEQKDEIKLMNISGQTCIMIYAEERKEQINIKSLPPGMYHISIWNSNRIKHREKIVKY